VPPSETQLVQLSAPSTPTPPETSGPIAKAISLIPEVAEAHLPMCFIQGVTPTAELALVVILTPGADPQAMRTTIDTAILGLALGRRLMTSILPHDAPDLANLRSLDCGILWTTDAPPREAPRATPFPPGTRMDFSRPVQPLPGYLVRCITSVLATMPAVIEAHLPMLLLSGAGTTMSKPVQVLALVPEDGANVDELIEAVRTGIARFVRDDQKIDIMTLGRTSAVLEAARKVGCQIWETGRRNR
jgi:hypothetical protein